MSETASCSTVAISSSSTPNPQQQLLTTPTCQITITSRHCTCQAWWIFMTWVYWFSFWFRAFPCLILYFIFFCMTIIIIIPIRTWCELDDFLFVGWCCVIGGGVWVVWTLMAFCCFWCWWIVFTHWLLIDIFTVISLSFTKIH